TTTCLSLGACLAEMGRTVLLIDLDPQANLTLSVGLKPEELRHTISEALLGNASLVSISRESNVFGMDIVPASRELTVIDKILYGRKNYEFFLRRKLEAIDRDSYDFVLVDCPPYFGVLTLNALTAANLLIIPVQCEYYAMYALRQTIELAKMVRERTNPWLDYRVLVTMYDQRNKISQLMLAQMRQKLDRLLYDTVIEIDTKLKESPVFGKPITLYEPKTRSANQYRALAKELINHG
ncbi:MAG: ParA family protein, partial [Anaerolineae bacterium]|nr:ParA family protein [Anaerolineae bacterium]